MLLRAPHHLIDAGKASPQSGEVQADETIFLPSPAPSPTPAAGFQAFIAWTFMATTML
jgi:hypothetical protein